MSEMTDQQLKLLLESAYYAGRARAFWEIEPDGHAQPLTFPAWYTAVAENYPHDSTHA
ncbi:hypothetical protein SEA_JONJAMES_193 [Gordonia Phage JonJames]|nr:hypothetical protein SEA_JONJAMES_193 [Gordonia Phage JonJames]